MKISDQNFDFQLDFNIFQIKTLQFNIIDPIYSCKIREKEYDTSNTQYITSIIASYLGNIRYQIVWRSKKVCFWHDELLIMIYGIFTKAIFLCIFFRLPYKYKSRKHSDNISMLNVMIRKYMLKYENWVTLRSRRYTATIIYVISYFFDLEYFRSLPFVLDAASAIFWKVSKNEPKTTIVVLIIK